MGVGIAALFPSATKFLSSLLLHQVRPNLPPFGRVYLEPAPTIAGGRASLASSNWLNSASEVSDWPNEKRNTKVGYLLILRKLMCYSFSASKDQEVCSLCVAEKFSPSRTGVVGGGGDKCPQNRSASCNLRLAVTPGVASGKQREPHLTSKKSLKIFYFMERKEVLFKFEGIGFFLFVFLADF